MIELWHEWNSVHSFKVRVVLAEKGLEWADHRVELLKFEQLRPDYLRLNPNGVVPTLVHDGRVIVESSVICEYLDEAFREPAMMPAGPFARSQGRRWLKYHDDVAHAAMRKASFQLLYKPLLKQIPPAELALRLRNHPDPERARNFREAASGDVDFSAVGEAMAQFALIAARIDVALEGRAWLSGDSFGLADAAMAPFAERIDNLGMRFVWASRPRGDAWAERILSRASVVESLAPARYRLSAPVGDTRDRVLEIAASIVARQE